MSNQGPDDSFNREPDYDAINEDWKANEGFERLRAERDDLAARLETTTAQRDAAVEALAGLVQFYDGERGIRQPDYVLYKTLTELMNGARAALVKAGRE